MHFGRVLPCIALISMQIGFAATVEKPVDFDREIRPILSDNCFTCHGPDEKKRLSGVRFDTREGAFAKPNVIVPGKAAESHMYQRISAEKPAMRMPPVYSGKKLNQAQIELIKRWIDTGAKWERHWSYLPPKRPELPVVQDERWARNPIDRFVLAQLEKDGLHPSPEADKATLLRRVTLDLTGLPPTPEELDSFVNDRSPNAYETRVDRLLASPRYGERMAMMWLDLARYADTHGYHIDSHREMWHWRDWVIQAFNRNMPYDEFTVEQLAGDLLPNATVSQKIATGFNRNHMINFEGGAIPEEYQTEYVVDRVEATSVTWLGMTMGCARCHDHKYDPIKQKDFYSFFAFFNNISEKGLDGRKGNAEPILLLPSEAQQARLDELKTKISADESILKAGKVEELEAAWEKEKGAAIPAGTRKGLTGHYEMDGNLGDSSGHYRHGRVLAGEVNFAKGPANQEARFNGEAHVDFGEVLPLKNAAPFTIAAWMKTNGQSPMTVVEKIEDPVSRRGLEISFDQSLPLPRLQRGTHLLVSLTNRWPDNAIQVETKERILQTGAHHVAIEYDGSGKAAGIHVLVNGVPFATEVLKDNLTGSIETASTLQLGNKAWGAAFDGVLDDLRIYDRALSAGEAKELAEDAPQFVNALVLKAQRSKEQNEALRAYFLEHDAPAALSEAHRELKAMQAEQDLLNDTIPSTMVMNELEKPRETFILGRGDYRNHLEKVTADVPSALPPLPKDAPHNRLGLAKWLVSPDHPLTSRVAVNRYWQMYFGTGIVKTTEDFGSQGDPPSHPELLDWLATEFVRTGWDVKAMQKLIVTSATYRQSSRVTPELETRDPENRLLARGPRFRLPAETVRDNALAVSGLLDRRVGGASVFPYQPKGLWEELAFGDVYSAQYYVQSKGADLYRRSMYTFWKRTSPPPALTTFDAPDREKCTGRRLLTNSPLQALVLLNDETYVEAARALAQRMLLEGGAKPDQRLTYGFRLATGRTPSREELAILKNGLTRHLMEYGKEPKAADELLHVGESPFDARLKKPELAAWTALASTILNLDETITKE